MQSIRNYPIVALVVAAVIAALALSACGGMSGGSGGVADVIQRLSPYASKCNGKAVNVVVDVDESGSDRGAENPLTSPRLNEIAQASDAAVACGGSESVVAFSSSLSDSATLASTVYPTSYGTTNARLIHNSKVEAAFLVTAKAALMKPSAAVGASGTDVLSQFDLAAREAEQDPSARLEFVLETDGMSNVGAAHNANPRTFTQTDAEKDARTVTVPQLGSGTTVSMVGIGKTAASGQHQPPTAYVLALTTYYTRACLRTGARCAVTTTYPNGD